MKNNQRIASAIIVSYLIFAPSFSYAVDGTARDDGSSSSGASEPIAPTPSQPVFIFSEPEIGPQNFQEPLSGPPLPKSNGTFVLLAFAVIGALAYGISKIFAKGSQEKTDDRCKDIKTLLEQKLRELEDSAKSWPEDKLKELIIAKTLTEEQKALLAKYQSAKEKYENIKKTADLLKGEYDLCMLNLPSAKQKRVFIIHGWGGRPDEHWLPWLKKELESRNFKVAVPEMPDTEHPKIEAWVNYLKDIVGEPDENTFFVGHSVGCQAIMRYLETLENKQAGGAVFVAGWFKLDNLETEEIRIAEQWHSPIDFGKVIHTLKNPVTVFLSSDEPYGYVEENKKIFTEKLDAEVIVEKNKWHFTHDDGADELPEVLEAILRLAGK